MELAGPTPRRGPQWATLAKALLAALAIVAIGWSFTLHRDDAEPVVNGGEVELVSPVAGAPVVPAQSPVSADLQYGFRGTLQIHGVDIPEDQIDFVEAQGIVSFTPGPDKELRKLPGGYIDVKVIYWPLDGTREDDAREYTWHFTVN